LKAKPLYQMFEEKYRNEKELPQLEERKKRLEELRKFHAPIHTLDLHDHTKAYEVLKKEKEREILKHRDDSVRAERDRYQKLK
jgi:hypothetical protein